jgi:hypothetical protein
LVQRELADLSCFAVNGKTLRRGTATNMPPQGTGQLQRRHQRYIVTRRQKNIDLEKERVAKQLNEIGLQPHEVNDVGTRNC